MNNAQCICQERQARHSGASQSARIGCVGGIVLSLVWMVVLRYGAGVMAWLTILMANFGMTACTMLAYEKASGLHLRLCRWRPARTSLLDDICGKGM